MAVQTAIKTVHGRGTAKFDRELNSGHGSDGWKIKGWGAALDGFDMRFAIAPIAGGHDVRGVGAGVQAVHFAPPTGLSVEAVSTLTNDEPNDSSSKMSVLAIASDTSDTNQLYLFTQPPQPGGSSSSYQFPGAVSSGYAGLAGFNVFYPFSTSDHYVQSISASVGNNTIGSTTQTISPTISVSINDNSGHSGGGSASLVYVGIPTGSNVQAAQDSWSPGGGATYATFTTSERFAASAFVLIVGFDITFGSDTDHQVSKISLSAGNDTVLVNWTQNTSGWTATVYFRPSLEISDSAGHTISSSATFTTYVFLLPA
jgi:hypothetical protein